MRIAIFNRHIPRPDQASGDRRLYEILQILGRGHHVDYYYAAWTKEFGDERYVAMLKAIKITPLQVRRVRLTVAWNLLLTRYDLGIFEFYAVAKIFLPLFRVLQRAVPALVDSVDVHYLRTGMQKKCKIDSHDNWQTEKAEELDVYRAADGVIAVSHEDEEELKAEGIAKVYYLPNIIPPYVRQPYNESNIVLFVGGFAHIPNQDAVHWLVKEIWPEVIHAVPDAELRIIGSKMPDCIHAYSALPGVKPLGFIADIREHLNAAAVSVAPLRFGAGMKGKVNEAMTAGIPVVSTSVGLQGIGGESGKHYFRADTVAEFSKSIIELLQNSELRVTMGDNARDLSAHICSRMVAEAGINAILTDIRKE